ncbi:MAG: hypothetical protein GZ090_12120 [Oxalobacteraceae bacterium]|nr:hypothetical protein [Oxalobacteraceae bacterium]
MRALLLNPWVWLALIVGVLFSSSVGGVLGYRLSNQRAELRQVTATVQADKQLSSAMEKVRDIERGRSSDLQAIAVKHKQEMDDAKTKMDALRADVRSGAVRLSIATKSAGDRAASGNPAAAAGASAETRSELSGPAAEFLIGLADECDANAIQLNAVIDAYAAIRKPSPSEQQLPRIAPSQ